MPFHPMMALPRLSPLNPRCLVVTIAVAGQAHSTVQFPVVQFSVLLQHAARMLIRLAARRGISVVQDVVSIDGNNLTSPIYSGKANQTVTVNGDVVVSVRANVFSAVGSGSSNEVSVVDASGDVKTAVQEIMERASARLDVSKQMSLFLEDVEWVLLQTFRISVLIRLELQWGHREQRLTPGKKFLIQCKLDRLVRP